MNAGSIILLIILIVLYIVPSIIAYHRQHASRMAILLINIAFGWTAVGWLLSLIWSLANSNVPQQIVITNSVQK
ncbi:superinfection immunity protein [Paraburkholderia terrae]|uniref:superinfection immunity protein n=1 Tax=Paraburkholderia terrae TaxID=311230 RepID=UPI001E32293D|nr:superinfection immunity protein [Paraburkholderia terrae]